MTNDYAALLQAKNQAAQALSAATLAIYKRRFRGRHRRGLGEVPAGWEARREQLATAYAEALAPLERHRRERLQALDAELTGLAWEWVRGRRSTNE